MTQEEQSMASALSCMNTRSGQRRDLGKSRQTARRRCHLRCDWGELAPWWEAGRFHANETERTKAKRPAFPWGGFHTPPPPSFITVIIIVIVTGSGSTGTSSSGPQ